MTSRELVLESARKEFLAKGYKLASVRDITGKVGLTTGAIYGLFDGKEDLFDAIVKDDVAGFIRMMERMGEDFTFNDFEDRAEGYKNMRLCILKCTREFIDYYFEHEENLHLALFLSEGSNYENIREYLLNYNLMRNQKYFMEIAGEPDGMDKEFLLMMGEGYISRMTSVLVRPYSRAKIERYVSILVDMYMECFRILCESKIAYMESK